MRDRPDRGQRLGLRLPAMSSISCLENFRKRKNWKSVPSSASSMNDESVMVQDHVWLAGAHGGAVSRLGVQGSVEAKWHLAAELVFDE